jgi:hypothetical protein
MRDGVAPIKVYLLRYTYTGRGIYSRGYTVLYKSNTKVIHMILTSYALSVDKILLGVYSYTQAKSYIRVETVDKYHLHCGQLLPRGQ